MFLVKSPYLYFSIPLLWVLCACNPPETDFSKILAQSKVAVETTRDVTVFYSDSAKLRVKITGPLSKRYTRGYAVEEEFPEGVYVEFLGASGTPDAWLTADYAIRKEAEKLIITRGNVVLENLEGEKIEGPELIWDERKREIYSNRFVKITTGDEIIYSYTFRSDESFTRMELKAIEGDMRFEQIDQ